jgi:putative nucleotidyltransferase with HDIG domain
MRQHPTDVVVSDVILPQATGIELLVGIRELSADIQVIMISGEPTFETAAMAVRKGAFDYLAKPVGGKAICRAVAKAAEVKKLLDEKKDLLEANRQYQKHLEELVRQRTTQLEESNLELRTEIVERKSAQSELQRSVDALRDMTSDTIHAMSATIDKRDPYTAGHQMHVADLSRLIAEMLGLPPAQVEGTFTAALLHDLGKIAIPAEILSKPNQLWPEEYALIKRHCIAGYEILESIKFPWPVAMVARQHHERMNGSGYPDGLRGEGILLDARIVAVADVVEAMAHHRPYRVALGVEAAMAEITANRGSLYDPNVVNACQRIFSETGFNFDKP